MSDLGDAGSRDELRGQQRELTEEVALLQAARDLLGRAHLGALDLARADQVEVVAGVALWKVWGDGGEQAVVEGEVAALVFEVAEHVPRR